MSAADLLRRAQALLADPATAEQAAQLVTQAVQRIEAENGERHQRIERERVRLMQARAVVTCLAVALDEEADVNASDVVELVAGIVLDATHRLDSVALRRSKT